MAFGTRTKTAEMIEIPFGVMNELDPSNSVLRGVTILEGEVTILGKTYPISLTPRGIANWTGPCSGVHTIEADA